MFIVQKLCQLSNFGIFLAFNMSKYIKYGKCMNQTASDRTFQHFSILRRKSLKKRHIKVHGMRRCLSSYALIISV